MEISRNIIQDNRSEIQEEASRQIEKIQYLTEKKNLIKTSTPLYIMANL